MVTQTPHPAVKTKPRGSVLHQAAEVVYVAAQIVLPVALSLALVALGQRDDSLAPVISWLTSEPLRPLGLTLLALGISLVAEAVSRRRTDRTDADADATD